MNIYPKITIQSEITLEQLYQVIIQLSCNSVFNWQMRLSATHYGNNGKYYLQNCPMNQN